MRNTNSLASFFYRHFARAGKKTSFPSISLLLLAYSLPRERFYRCVAKDVCSGFIIPAFGRHVAILFIILYMTECPNGFFPSDFPKYMFPTSRSRIENHRRAKFGSTGLI
jgi:hypothetical protein